MAWLIGLLVVVATAAPTPSEVAVEVGTFHFDDSTIGDGRIVVEVGDRLALAIVEGNRHTVTIDELEIDSGRLAVGDRYLTPPLDVPGTYYLYCQTHRNKGHSTTLIVVDPLAESVAGTAGDTVPPVSAGSTDDSTLGVALAILSLGVVAGITWRRHQRSRQ